AFWISANTSGSSSFTRERSIRSPRLRAIRSTHSSTAASIPSPSRSILRKPASAQESLSHWPICRPSIAAGWRGTGSTGGWDEITVEEAAEREVVRDRVDVREAGQVADERADRGAAAAARGQNMLHRAGAAHLERNLARELEHLPVEEEEAGETELVDERELLL